MKLDLKTCLRAGVTIFLLYLCIHYWPVAAGAASLLFSAAMPLVLGAAMAYFVNILMTFYERHLPGGAEGKAGGRARRPLCMTLAFATLLIIVVLLLVLVIPELISCIRVIAAGVPAVAADLTAWFEKQGVLPAPGADLQVQKGRRGQERKVGKTLKTHSGGLLSARRWALSKLLYLFCAAV